MKLSVVYAGSDSKKRRDLRDHNKNVIILLFDKWDDFNYKTTFPTECRIDGESVEVGSIQILIDGEIHLIAMGVILGSRWRPQFDGRHLPCSPPVKGDVCFETPSGGL